MTDEDAIAAAWNQYPFTCGRNCIDDALQATEALKQNLSCFVCWNRSVASWPGG